MLDVQQVAQVAHKEEAVRCDDHRDDESAPPPLKQSICAVYVCGGTVAVIGITSGSGKFCA
jgi:hypothetical protein